MVRSTQGGFVASVSRSRTDSILLVLATVAGAVLGGTWPCPVSASEFEVEGGLRIETRSANGTLRTSNDYRFLARVDGDRWFLRRDDLAVETGRATNDWRIAVAYDGRDMYRTTEFLPSAVPPDAAASTNVFASTNLLYGFAEEGRFPYAEGLATRVLWLAYCSAPAVLAGRGIPSIRDPGNMNRQPVAAEADYMAPGNLPSRFEQSCPGFFGKREQAFLFPPPFDHGWVDFEYHVLGHTNYMGTSLPLSFSAGVYVPSQSASSGWVRFCATTITGWVSRAGSLQAPVATPALTQQANLYDYRFTTNSRRPFMYVEEPGGQWLQRTDRNLAATFRSKHRMLPDKPTKASAAAPAYRRWVLALLACVSGCPIAIYLVARRRRVREAVTK